MDGYFRREQAQGKDVFIPAREAVSGWGDIVRGPAITSLLARAIERAVASPADAGANADAAGAGTDAGPKRAIDFIPAKTTFDLHSPLPLVPVTTTVTVLRSGRRLKLIDAELIHDGRVYARARSLWLKQAPEVDVSDNPTWQPDHSFTVPGPGPWNTTDDERIYWSAEAGYGAANWSDQGIQHQNSTRKASWQFPVPTVVGETLSGFQAAAHVCDVANLTTNWGPDGLDFINADATLYLVRYPVGDSAGVVGLDRVEHDGIANGTALLYDEAGQFGTAHMTTIVQQGGRVRFPDPAVDPVNKMV